VSRHRKKKSESEMTRAVFSSAEIQKRKRINVALWAYAYEYENTSIVSDSKFDQTCLEIDLSIATDRLDLDAWFQKEFNSHTGQWVHNHPEKKKLKTLFDRLKTSKVIR